MFYEKETVFEMIISMVAAMGENRVIGNQGIIPWKIPGEQKLFKELTLGKGLVIGRKTYESIGRALPGRTTIVVTRQTGLTLSDALVANSLEAALSIARSVSDEVIIGGGADLYAQALPIADKVYLTTVRKCFEGDALFPDLPERKFFCVASRDVEAVIPYTFAVYERVKHNLPLHADVDGGDELTRYAASTMD